MTDPTHRSDHTFVVRIWSADETKLLRGHIQHTRTRKRTYFASRDRLLSFIRDHIRTTERGECQS
jgi:hypothetical protein